MHIYFIVLLISLNLLCFFIPYVFSDGFKRFRASKFLPPIFSAILVLISSLGMILVHSIDLYMEYIFLIVTSDISFVAMLILCIYYEVVRGY